MRPGPEVQIRWGIAAAAVALAVVMVLAFVPDPLFRQRLYVTSVDDVEQVTPGVQVYFRGAELGAVRSVRLQPNGAFKLQLGVRRAWTPGACSYAAVRETNPFTAPRLELTSLDVPAGACARALTAAGCSVLSPPPGGGTALPGCRRGPGLFETAAAAVGQAAEVAKAANLMALQVQKMMGGAGGPSLTGDLTKTLATLNALTARLNDSLEPGRGDIARTLQNVRVASGQAASVDVKSLNATLADARTMVADMQGVVSQNQANVNTLLKEGAAASSQTRALLETVSASMAATSGNLERATNSLDALAERLSNDPTYVVRGQRFADPPPPGAR